MSSSRTPRPSLLSAPPSPQAPHSAGRRRLLMAAMASAFGSTALVACGGGGGDSAGAPAPAPPPAATGSFTAGAISGFGSIIVNGVRFDDSGAEVFDDDGQRRGSDDLKLGQQVEVESSSIDRSAGTGVATVIRYGSELKGPVESVDAANSRFVLLGQVVEVVGTTVFGPGLSGGLAAVAVGQILEVHGRLDTARSVTVASRVDLEDSTSRYKLRGVIAALDTAARTLRIGSASISYAGASEVPSSLAVGQGVRVELQTTPSGGFWLATRVRSDSRQPEDRAEAEIKGLITSVESATRFSVDGLSVQADAAQFPDGQGIVQLGAFVEVEGRISGGVLVASEVKSEDDGGEDEQEDFELHGSISSLDTAAKTFVLRNLTVRYSGSVAYEDGTEAGLANGVEVEVKGVLDADGTSLRATRISFED